MPCGDCVPRGWWRSQHRPHSVSVVPLLAAVAYCGGGGRASPGACRHCGERLSSGAPPSPAARLWAGCRGPLPACCGRGSASVGCQCGGTVPSGRMPRVGLRAAGVVGGRLRGGLPSTIARGVRCPALPLPLPPVLWGGWPGFRDLCVLGAVGVGVGAQHRPHALRDVDTRRGGGGRASPGGAVRRCEGCLRSGVPPPPAARPLGGLSGSAIHVLWARVCGCGGPALSSWLACGGCVPWGWWGAVPGGMARHCCEGRLVSGAVPAPAALPLGRAAGVPRPVCPGCCWYGRGDPAPAPQRAPLRAGVARCGGGGRASPGGYLSPL